jgi:hypothetical protein
VLNLFPTFNTLPRERESGVDDRTKADWTVAGRATVREADLSADENIVGGCVCCI